MSRTQVRSAQLGDNEVKRVDLNTTEAGQAVITKAIAGAGIIVTSTGVDAGTGDVTVTAGTLTQLPGTVAMAAGYAWIMATDEIGTPDLIGQQVQVSGQLYTVISLVNPFLLTISAAYQGPPITGQPIYLVTPNSTDNYYETTIDINSLVEKQAISLFDYFLIEDSEDNYSKKKVTMLTFLSALLTGFSVDGFTAANSSMVFVDGGAAGDIYLANQVLDGGMA